MRRDLAHEHGDIALLAQDVAQRRGDRRRREAGGGDLVQQRLEQVMVAAIDQGDVHRRLARRRALPTGRRIHRR